MRKASKKEKRSWMTSIISGCIAVVSLFITVISFRLDLASMLVSFVFGIFSILAIIIAIQGKRKTLRELFEALFHLP